jgi:uncharacterized protein (TIGR02246 family)
MALTTDDVVAIEQLVAKYNHAIDSGDGSTFASTFTEDGVLEAVGASTAGREALEKFANGFGGTPMTPRHVATNILVDGEGDKATLRAYIQMYAKVGDPPTSQLTISGRYEDELRRVDGRWLFTRRSFVAD